MRTVGFLCLLLCGLSRAADNEAHLLSSKNVLSEFPAEGKDLTVQYRIYNIGSSSALSVVLKDESYPAEQFEFVRGQPTVRWERLSPGNNVTHVVIVRPLVADNFNFTAATVTYKPSETAEEKVSFTSAPGVRIILSGQLFDRQHSPHLLDWAAFALFAAPSILVPFLIWYKSYSHYSAKIKKS